MSGIEFAQLIGPSLLFLMMLGMGMAMTREDVTRVITEPRAVTIGTVNQMLVLPCIGFALASLFNVPGEIAAGILLLTLCPGGVGSNMISLLARGDAALSVTLTLISSCLIIFTLPPAFNFFLNHFVGQQSDIEFPVWTAIQRVFFITLLPIALGMLINRKWPELAQRSQVFVKSLGFLLMGLMIIGIAVKEWQLMVDYAEQAGMITLLLCSSTMLLGFLSARLFRLNRPQSTSISIEVGMQNSALAIVIAGMVGSADMAVPAVIYTMVVSGFSLALIIWANWLQPNQRQAQAPDPAVEKTA